EPSRRARPRGDRLLPAARRRSAHQGVEGRAARAPADAAQQVPRHVRPHAHLQHPCVGCAEARRRALLHRRQQPAVPDHARGGDPYASAYVRLVQRTADPRVLFPGYVFGPGYWELQKNAYLLCVPTEVGGTHPILLEGLAAGNCILVNDYRPNAETVGDAGVYFSGTEGVPDLARQLERLLADESLVEDYRARARRRAEMYSWDAVATAYEHMLLEVRGGSRPGP